MGKTSNRIKLFKKVFNEFLKEYSSITGAIISIPIKTIEPLTLYRQDVESVIDQFASKNVNILGNIRLLSTINFSKVQVNWSYLFNMYSLTLEKGEENLLETASSGVVATTQPAPQTLPGLPGGLNIGALLNSGAIQNLVAELAPMVTQSLEGKDLSKISMETLMSDIVTGKSESGIDTASVLKHTMDKMKDKISSGELKLD